MYNKYNKKTTDTYFIRDLDFGTVKFVILSRIEDIQVQVLKWVHFLLHQERLPK